MLWQQARKAKRASRIRIHRPRRPAREFFKWSWIIHADIELSNVRIERRTILVCTYINGGNGDGDGGWDGAYNREQKETTHQYKWGTKDITNSRYVNIHKVNKRWVGGKGAAFYDLHWLPTHQPNSKSKKQPTRRKKKQKKEAEAKRKRWTEKTARQRQRRLFLGV